MRRTIIALAALTAATPALAEAPCRTVRDGNVEIQYLATPQADGTTVLESAQADGARPFRLVVRDGRVSGTVSGSPVSFRAPRGQEVASR